MDAPNGEKGLRRPLFMSVTQTQHRRGFYAELALNCSITAWRACRERPANGGAFGGQVGFNYQWNQIVLGAEVDGDWLNLKASAACVNPTFTCNTELNHQFSARGRLGVAFDRFLVYGTGGVAWTTFDGSTVNATTTFSDTSDRTGWIVGAGAEYAVWDHLIIGAEYLHADFGSSNMQYDSLYPNVKVTTDVVRARVSWLFNMH
jgi:outer membrane autotransporter barrel domain